MIESLLWLLAASMACITAWFVKKASRAKSYADNALVVYLLATMSSMYGGAVIYLLTPTSTSIIEAFGLNMVVMSGGIIVVLKYWAKGAIDEQIPSPTIAVSTIQDSDALALERADAITHAYVVFILVMTASMISIAIIYVVNTTAVGLEAALAVGTAIMTFGIALILVRLSKYSKKSVDELGIGARSYSTSATIIFLILVNEVLMGVSFALASGTPKLSLGSNLLQTSLSTFTSVVGSYWFIFTMAFEMALSILMLRREFSKIFITIVSIQSAVMFFSPTAIDNQLWHTLSIYLSSILMITLMIIVFEYLYKVRSVSIPVKGYTLSLLILYALMMASLFTWISLGNSLLFAIAIIGEMVLYFSATVGRGKVDGPLPSTSWLSDPLWVFAVMLSTFIAEFFMGALIDVQFYGPGFLNGISYAVVAGPIATQISATLYNFLSFFGAITGSAWFYIMMGAEMGALVIFKIRYTRELETKVRLILLVITYGVYSVYLPFFFFYSSPDTLARIPFLGWSMGIGTGGPVAPTLLTAIALTYVISGSLSFLFGGRQMCSMFCTAALMYQGTFPDAMKDFNRTSKMGRKLLTSRMSNVYKLVSSTVLTSLIVSTVISYLNSVGIIRLTIFGNDAATFLYHFYFDFLWYVIFITIPFIGTYGCVTTGMCHWGLFNQFVSRFGFFKLRVKDPNVCVNCQTKDCAKACPVGLTDLPGRFISSGEFKSHKCIGVGNCVSACPYMNEYFYDVRGWIREKAGMEDQRHKSQLPVLKYGSKLQSVDESL